MPEYLIHWKFKMSAIFVLKKEPPKKQFFYFFRGCYSVMGATIDLNVVLFWETAGFLKSVVLQLFPKHSQSYANLNVKSKPKIQQPLIK